MDSSTVAVLLVIGLVVLIAFFIFLMFYTTARHHQQVSNVLIPLGFEKNDADKDLVTSKFSIVSERYSKDKRAAVINLHRKQAAEYTLYVCEYHLMSASGRARGADYLLAGVLSQDLHLPRFTVEPNPQQFRRAGKMLEAVFSNLSTSTLQKIQTSNPQFNDRFNLYAPAGLSVDDLVSEAAMRLLLSAGNITLDAKGDTFVLSSLDIESERVARKFDPHKLRQLVDLARMLTDEFRHGKKPGTNREIPQA
ncbi:MAG: hypothetical protein RMK99_05690 [Anaerolineales bacterium]|nr:hypothetical protein [Anaerolineales bacterium]